MTVCFGNIVITQRNGESICDVRWLHFIHVDFFGSVSE